MTDQNSPFAFRITPFEEKSGPVVPGERLVVFQGENAAFIHRGELGAALPESGVAGAVRRLRFGMLGNAECSALEYSERLTLAPEIGFMPVRQLWMHLDPAQANALLRGKAVLFWRRKRRYCGSCGAQLSDVTSEAARHCEKCGEIFYPVVSPAVIVAVTDEQNRLLLAHNRKFKNNMYSLIAGFVEAGESLEQAVERELEEEVGVKVRGIRYFGSQSWPFPGSLMAGFSARYDSGAVTPDGTEIENAAFYAPSDIPNIPSPGSIARTLIDCWKKGTLL